MNLSSRIPKPRSPHLSRAKPGAASAGAPLCALSATDRSDGCASTAAHQVSVFVRSHRPIERLSPAHRHLATTVQFDPRPPYSPILLPYSTLAKRNANDNANGTRIARRLPINADFSCTDPRPI